MKTNANKNHLPHARHPAGPTAMPSRRKALQGLGWVSLGVASTFLPGCGGGAADGSVAAASGEDERRRALGGVDSGGTGIVESFFSAAFSAVTPLTAGGVVFDTAGCQYTDGEGASLPAGTVGTGMTGRIAATAVQTVGGVRTAGAVSVVLAEALRGPAQSLDLVTSSFSVLGQRVVTNSATVFGAGVGTLAGVPAAGPVRVWGRLDTAGNRVVATRIDAAPPSAIGVVRGVLTLLDRVGGLVRIGAFEAHAGPGTAAMADGLAPGAVVRARAVPATGGGWALLSLTDDSLVIPDGLQAEIEGTVTQATSGRLFRVDGVAVDASSVFNDSTLAPLPGVRAEVHGRMQAGVLRAQSVAFEAGDTLLEIEGRVSSVDTVARRFVLRGYTVAWGTATRFEGGPASMLRTNRRVAVRGRWNTDRTGVDALSVHIEA